MRVFVAGASGALGSHLVPQLIDAGHEVIGTHNSPESAQLVEVLGAEPVRLDLLDERAVHTAVLGSRPDAIVHEATALGGVKFGRNLDKATAATLRLRAEGTDALLAAAAEAGVRRFVAQSFAPFLYARQGGPVKTEADPVDQAPLRGTSKAFAAITHLEKVTTDFGGIVLRYGGFYGAANDALIEPVRKRRLPIVGNGDLQHRRRRSCPGTRVAPGARRGAGRQATPPRTGLAGPPDRWLGSRGSGHPGARLVERQGQARTRLDPPIPQLAHWLPGDLLGDRGRGRAGGRPGRRRNLRARLSPCSAQNCSIDTPWPGARRPIPDGGGPVPTTAELDEG